jgi:radical SAM/SPASM domain protein of ACGX system
MAGSFGLQWHITNRCDQRCKHCYIFNSGIPVGIRESDINEARYILDDFARFCTKVDKTPNISLTGGDPILSPFFWTIVEMIHDMGIKFCILGNPFHVNETMVRKLVEMGCVSYQMSLDGLSKTHDLIRKQGSFNSTVEAISILNRVGLKANIMTTVSKSNYLEIPELSRITASNEVNVHAFARYCPTHSDIDQNMSPDEYRQFLDTMWRTYVDLAECRTSFTLKDHLWTPYLYEMGLMSLMKDDDVVYGGCACGVSHMTLLENGIVYACRRFESPVGNVFEKGFESIFFSKELSHYRKIDDLENCKDCSLLNYCRGCHAVAAGTYGDFFRKDPQCWFLEKSKGQLK